jgi:DNA sulfur modification protein DndD
MNDVAWKAGEDTFTVTIYFSHNESQYVLSRSCEITRLQNGEKSKSKQKMYLKKGNDFVANEEIDRIISEILNEKISIFFLCDMEVLSEYEKLVRDDTAASIEVKQAIENILGVPALVSVRDALRSIESDAFKEIKKIDTLNSEAEVIKNKIIEEEKRNKEFKAEDKKIVENLNAKKAELSKVNKALEEFESVADFIRQEQDLERQNISEQKEIESLRNELQQAIKESWWLPISDVAEGKFQQTQEATSTAARRQEKLSDKQGQLKRLTESKDTGRCAECKQLLNDDYRKQVERDLGIISLEIEELSRPLIPSIESLVEESKRLSQFRVPAKASLIASHERRIRKLRNDITSRKQSIQDLKKRIGEVNRDDIQELSKARAQLERVIGGTTVILQNNTYKITNSDSELGRLNRELANSSTGSDKSAAQLEHSISTYLNSVFERSVDAFRDITKRQVEASANDIYKRLVSENAHNNLRINDNYGLRLIDDDGVVFDHKGAGVAQVIALSLIMALGRAAVRSAALVLDTPFARLDDTHRDNILLNIWNESSQVILLLQSGEKISETVLRQIQGKIARQFKIIKGASPKESYIEVMK